MRQRSIPRALKKIDPETFNAAMEASSNISSNLAGKAHGLLRKGVPPHPPLFSSPALQGIDFASSATISRNNYASSVSCCCNDRERNKDPQRGQTASSWGKRHNRGWKDATQNYAKKIWSLWNWPGFYSWKGRHRSWAHEAKDSRKGFCSRWWSSGTYPLPSPQPHHLNIWHMTLHISRIWTNWLSAGEQNHEFRTRMTRKMRGTTSLPISWRMPRARRPNLSPSLFNWRFACTLF